jgi:hypothetical protein
LTGGKPEMTTTVSITATHPDNAALTKRAFIARKMIPMVEDEETGIFTPDPEGTPYFKVESDAIATKMLNDLSDPGTLKMQQSDAHAEYQLVVAVWGPNLIPVFAHADFEIQRR